jgi:hypothetical protein
MDDAGLLCIEFQSPLGKPRLDHRDGCFKATFA